MIESFKLNNAVNDGINVIILGKPNVGKSTLLNSLLEDDKAIVSEIPGTTRDLIEDTITIGNNIVRFTDTAGLRDTNDKVESIGINKALKKIKDSSIILYVFDLSKTNIKSMQIELSKDYLQNKNLIILGNKSDLKVENQITKYFENNNYNIMSSMNKKDILKLKNLLNQFIVNNIIDDDCEVMINERHYNTLINVRKSIDNVKENLKNRSNTDLLALDIKYALDNLGQITGEVTNDEILGNIFSKFCIGK